MAKFTTSDDTSFCDIVLRRRFGHFVHPQSHRKERVDAEQAILPLTEQKEHSERGNGQRVTKVLSKQSWKHCLQELLATICHEKWIAYAFGGTARGLLHQGASLVPRDIDLVFSSEHFESFQQRFQSCVRSINRFGGLRMRVGHVDLDAWPIERTWAFCENPSIAPSFENLPKTTFLNIDALAVELFPRAGVARRIFDNGCIEAHRRRVLDINFYDNPLPDLCVIRTLHYAYKFEFGISMALRYYIHKEMRNFNLHHLMAVQERHYCQIWFDLNMLRKILEVIQDNMDEPLSYSRLFALHRQEKTLDDQIEQ